MKIYFAHPVSAYHTPEENRIVTMLKGQGFSVINPADAPYQDKIKEIRVSIPDHATASSMVMDYFYTLCAACDACAIMPFPDGSFGAGVTGEAEKFLRAGKPVYEILSENDGFSLKKLHSLDGRKCLGIQDTRRTLKNAARKKGLGQ